MNYPLVTYPETRLLPILGEQVVFKRTTTLGYQGKDIVIAYIDSGVDKTIVFPGNEKSRFEGVSQMLDARILAPGKELIRRFRIALYALRIERHVVVSYDVPERQEAVDLILKIKREAGMLLWTHEAYQIFVVVKATSKIAGDIAEVGVYKGGSAKLICEAKGDRELHLFDTFEGIPGTTKHDSLYFDQGQFPASYQNVANYLKDYSNVHLYKGIFPATAGPIDERKFSFVHLDVDVYESTLGCLDFFYPRMAIGGVIICHDYTWASGVRKACDDFFRNKPEAVIELTGTQCLVVKGR